MRRRGADEAVPADLQHFDVARWQAAAEADPDTRTDDQRRRPLDLYYDALLAAGVDEGTAASLHAQAVVDTIRSRIAAYREKENQ